MFLVYSSILNNVRLLFLQRYGSWGLHPGGVQQEPGWNNRPGSPAAEPDRNQGAVGHLQSLCPPKVSILFWKADSRILRFSCERGSSSFRLKPMIVNTNTWFFCWDWALDLIDVTGTWMVQPPTLTVMFWPTLALRWRRDWILPRSWGQKILVWCHKLISVCKISINSSAQRCSYLTVSLSPQCFGEEGKVSSPSIILMLLLNWSTWPTSSKWLSVSVRMSTGLIGVLFRTCHTFSFMFVTRVQREDWAEVPVSYWTQAQGALQTPVWLW